MKGITQIVKGRIEEAAGAISGSEKLRSKGQTDQAIGRVKKGAEKSFRKARETIDRIAEKVLNI
jgi:uncharacterized protein YjbJ (UPF0337 family)